MVQPPEHTLDPGHPAILELALSYILHHNQSWKAITLFLQSGKEEISFKFLQSGTNTKFFIYVHACFNTSLEVASSFWITL